MATVSVFEYMYRQAVAALEYCNTELKKRNEEIFDPSILSENFAQDLIMLAAQPICADNRVTYKEFCKLNEMLDPFGVEMDMAACEEFCRLVKENPFEIPKTLRIHVLKSIYVVENWRDSVFPYEFVRTNEFMELTNVILSYGNVMCNLAFEDKISPAEKKAILDALKKCTDFVVESFGEDFRKYCDYDVMVERACLR